MHEVAHVDISIDRDSGVPAYRQIYQQIRSQIAAGSIPAGALIPKIRNLSADLGVARPTEEAKISCAEKHFEALQLGDDFHYDIETRYHHLTR